jgi:hypothetical protein
VSVVKVVFAEPRLVYKLTTRKESENSWQLAVSPRILNVSISLFLNCRFKLERKTKVVQLLKMELSVGFKLRPPP